MTKPKALEQLRAEKERAETQLAQEQHKLERLENRKKYLEKGERTKRCLLYTSGAPAEKAYAWTIAQVKSILKEETYIGHSILPAASAPFSCS